MFAGNESVTSYHASVREKFGSLADDILRLNPAASDAAAAAATLGDVIFGESARLIARGVSQRQPKTFAYVFSRGIADRPQPATHSEDLPFVFGTLTEPSFISHPPPVRADQRLAALPQQTS